MTEGDSRGSENRVETEYGLSRRNVMKALGATAVSGGALTGTAAANQHVAENETRNGGGTGNVDSPEGFSAEVLAPYATFPEDVAAEFRINYDGDEEVAALDDASNVVVGKATWQPGGTSGWHRHPGAGIVNVVEGELEVVHADDCHTRTYTAGEAYLEPPQDIHIVTNPSETECAVVYGTFIGVPEGAPLQEMVEPQDC